MTRRDTWRPWALGLWTLAVLGLLAWLVAGKEGLRRHGERVYLALAPVDPRSLMQGDYMALRYRVEETAYEGRAAADPNRGDLVVAVDARRVATFRRFDDGAPLAADERRLRYHRQGSRIRVVPDAFFFQEGHAEAYAEAKYGLFHFGPGGGHMLVGLADADLRPLGPESPDGGS